MTYTYRDILPRIVYEDPGAAHQIRLFIVGNDIAVSCTCGATLMTGKLVTAQKALSVWRQHMRRQEEDV